jgi:hypothetical protein
MGSAKISEVEFIPIVNMHSSINANLTFRAHASQLINGSWLWT